MRQAVTCSPSALRAENGGTTPSSRSKAGPPNVHPALRQHLLSVLVRRVALEHGDAGAPGAHARRAYRPCRIPGRHPMNREPACRPPRASPGACGSSGRWGARRSTRWRHAAPNCTRQAQPSAPPLPTRPCAGHVPAPHPRPSPIRAPPGDLASQIEHAAAARYLPRRDPAFVGEPTHGQYRQAQQLGHGLGVEDRGIRRDRFHHHPFAGGRSPNGRDAR
jgi:hypothetical protein